MRLAAESARLEAEIAQIPEEVPEKEVPEKEIPKVKIVHKSRKQLIAERLAKSKGDFSGEKSPEEK